MLFSIIIPVYNVEKYLEQCLNSVFNQTFRYFEVICINDGSTDNSLSILEKYQQEFPRITILNQSNKGLSNARNTGIRASNGEYLFFLDSDDWIEENALQVLSEHITDKHDFICFNGRRYFEDGRTEEPDTGIIENYLTGWNYYNKYALISRKFHFVCAVLRLYRRKFLLENNLFFKEGIYHEDNLFTPIACYCAKTVKVIPDVLYVYRIREGSITQQNNHLKRIFDNTQISNELGRFFTSKIAIKKEVVNKVICSGYLDMFNWLINISNNKNKKDLLNLHEITDWKIFKEVTQQVDKKIMYYLLKGKKWNIFTLFYYFDFYVLKKGIRKIKKYNIYVYIPIN